jgi:hypothetical protein
MRTEEQTTGFFVQLPPNKLKVVQNLIQIHNFNSFQEYLVYLVESDIERVKNRNQPIVKQLAKAIVDEAKTWLPDLNASK